MKKDIVVIGGGVVGCGVARLLSAYQADVLVVERGHDVAEGASKANSGIVHAGFDAKPGSLKARLNVRGSQMYGALCRELSVPYGQPGALVVCFAQEDQPAIEALYAQGQENGVEGLEMLTGAQALALEPQLNPDVVCALHAPTSGLVSPYELTYALADHAALNGVQFCLNTEVSAIVAQGDGYVLHTSQGDIQAKVVVNCAGIGSAALHNQLSMEKLEIIPRKGEYYLLDRQQPWLFSRTLFQAPTPMGKGVLVTPTVHGNLLLGPTATDVQDGLDVSTTAEALAFVKSKACLTWPAESLRTLITTFAGVRAHEAMGDFIVGPLAGRQGIYEAIGIESPGLSAAPAIAELLAAQIAKTEGLHKKQEWVPYPKMPKPFHEMTPTEQAAAVRTDANHGNIICRCEQVTEAEIRAAIRRPVGARSIDGIKRRTRGGMGRCQGGFCSPRVLEILSEELGNSPLAVTKCGGESLMLTDTIQRAGEREVAKNAQHTRK